MNSINYFALIACYASLFIFGLVEITRGAVYPTILNSFNIGAGVGSMFFVLSAVSGLITNFSAKYWLQKFGAAFGLKVGLFAYLFGVLCLGISAQEIGGIFWHFLGAFVIGIGATGVGITINIITAQATPIAFRGRALSGLHAMYALAALVAPLWVSLGSSWKFQWHYYFLILALGPLLILIWMKFYFQFEDKGKGQELPPIPGNWKRYLPFGLLFGLYVAAETLTSTRLVFYLEQGRNLSPEMARDILTKYFLMFFLGRLSFVFINVREKNYFLLKTCLVITLCAFVLGVYISPWSFVLMGLGMSAFFSLAMDWVSGRFSDENGPAISFIFLAIGISITVWHFCFGQVAQNFGVGTSFQIIGILLFVCLSLIHI